MKCSKCSADLSPGVRFCGGCGSELQNGSVPDQNAARVNAASSEIRRFNGHPRPSCQLDVLPMAGELFRPAAMEPFVFGISRAAAKDAV